MHSSDNGIFSELFSQRERYLIFRNVFDGVIFYRSTFSQRSDYDNSDGDSFFEKEQTAKADCVKAVSGLAGCGKRNQLYC